MKIFYDDETRTVIVEREDSTITIDDTEVIYVDETGTASFTHMKGTNRGTLRYDADRNNVVVLH